MKSKTRLIVGVAALVVFGGLAFLNFNRTLARYVPFAEARASARSVQVAGFPDHQAARFDLPSESFFFSMDDGEGDVMKVVFQGERPGNFDQAEKVVVVGKYKEDALHASQILVKCPSKYDDLASEELRNEYETQQEGEGAQQGAQENTAGSGESAKDN